MKQLQHPATPLNESTRAVVSRAQSGHAKAVSRWKQAGKLVVASAHSRRNIGEALNIGAREHMSGVDVFDGDAARCGKPAESKTNDDLITVKPVVDGRLKNLGKGDANAD
jgi:5'-nucleotidase